jgi:Flp pilus assembly protein TadG
MGSSVYPASGGGGIKSVQRGLAASSGNVTITAVDTSKSFVTVFGTTSTGNVAASFGLTTNSRQLVSGNAAQYDPNTTATFTVNPGTTTLVAAVVQGYLSNSTTLVVSGACRWEVVEFN